MRHGNDHIAGLLSTGNITEGFLYFVQGISPVYDRAEFSLLQEASHEGQTSLDIKGNRKNNSFDLLSTG
jgi:hypothetical protein